MIKLHEAWGYSLKLSQWAEMFCLKKDTLYKRLQRGYDLETALSMGPYQSDTHPKYTAPDGESHTAREWAEIIGITSGAFRERISDGLPPEKVFAKRDLRIKDQEKKPVKLPEAGKGMVNIIYTDALSAAPSLATIKAENIGDWQKRYKYTLVLRKRP